MQITAKTWNEYITRLSRLNQKAGQLMRQYIDTHGTGDADALITYAAALVTKIRRGRWPARCMTPWPKRPTPGCPQRSLPNRQITARWPAW